MKMTRIVIGLATGICVTGPMVGLAHLSRDVRYLDFWSKAFYNTDAPFPLLSSLFLPFGPLDWWSYISPVALGVAVATALRIPISTKALGSILVGSILQLLAMIAVAKPYFMLTAVMGHFTTRPYPVGPLLANVCLLLASCCLAGFSVRRMLATTNPYHKTKIAEQDADGNPH